MTAILGGAGALGGLITIANFVTGRLDKRREREEARKSLDISQNVDLRKISLEESKFDEGIWEKIAGDLKAENEALKIRILDSKHQMDAVVEMFRRFHVAKVPDEVVDLITEKIQRAKTMIQDIRDKLG